LFRTPLVKKDTKEYREREAQAARLAQEIEKSEEYNKRVALENGDGADEEMLFSAVHRPGEANNNGAKLVTGYLLFIFILEWTIVSNSVLCIFGHLHSVNILFWLMV